MTLFDLSGGERRELSFAGPAERYDARTQWSPSADAIILPAGADPADGAYILRPVDDQVVRLSDTKWPVRWIGDSVVYWARADHHLRQRNRWARTWRVAGTFSTTGRDPREDNSERPADGVTFVNSQLAFILYDGGLWIYVHHPEPTAFEIFAGHGGTWSPNGRFAAFWERSSDPYYRQSVGQATVGVLDAQTGTARTFGPAASTFRGPRLEWSPDNSHLLVTW
ncbi:MAG: hypothetical protein EXR66_03485 [Dehalococcoidia bacterium]|nr:hypothetical protein [Dehalococcoidia bacterium]